MITDTFYVGWKQTTIDLLNIGFDVNNDQRSQILYNIYGAWETCPFEGALMMRPVFNSSPFLNSEFTIAEPDFKVYPNPANDIFYITGPEFCNEENTHFEIFDMQGRKWLQGRMNENGTNISMLSPGVYIVRLTHPAGISTTRLMIQK
jgi:hypothetical protein